MAFAPRQRNAAKTAPARSKLATSRLKTAQSQAPSGGKKSLCSASTSLKGRQSISTGPGGSVEPSSTRRVPSGHTQLRSLSTTCGVTKPPSSVSQPNTLESVLSRTTDPLQIAAQLYPWLYMTSRLDTALQAAGTSNGALDKRAPKELSEEDDAIADQRVRFDADRKIVLYEELTSNSTLSHELPEIMRGFLRSGDICDTIVAEVLQLRMNHLDDSSILHFNGILGKLEGAHIEANQFEFSVIQLLDSEHLAADSPIRPILAACLSVLRARIANLTVAQNLVDSSKDNLEMTLQLESLRLTDVAVQI